MPPGDSPTGGNHGPVDDLVLARFLTGRATVPESLAVAAWLAADPAHERDLDLLSGVWNVLGAPPPGPEADIDVRWEGLRRAMELTPPARSDVGTEVRLRGARLVPQMASVRGFGAGRAWGSGFVAAAAAVVVATVVWTNAHRRPVPQAEHQTVREVSTANGQRATLALVDGSRVTLGVASTLGYARVFGETRRDVYLQGEAVFDIIHDPHRPFVVHVTGASVEDLGTRFAVEAYADAPVRVTVVAGHVRVTTLRLTKHQSVPVIPLALNPGDLVRIAADGSEELLRGTDIEPYVAWTEGRLVFTGTPLRDAMPALGRWYDLDVRMADPNLDDLRLTASFKDEPIAAVLAVVSAALGLRVERHGRVVTFARVRER